MLNSPAIPAGTLEQLTIQQYHELISSGRLTDDDPVELLDGWLVEKMPKNLPHRIATRRTQKALESIVPSEWYVDAQEPITLDTSEPEPDVFVARGDTLDYPLRHPGSGDVALVVEIADATLQRDQTLKKSLYAAANIPVYWILNLVDNRLQVYTAPSGPASEPDYYQRQDYGLTEAAPVILDGREVGRLRVQELLRPIAAPTSPTIPE